MPSVLSNENALFSFDSNPFLANSYDKERKLWSVAKPHIEKLLAKNDFDWAAANRERILAEWSKRYESKSEKKAPQ